MKAVLLEVPQKMLAERRKLGLDGRDEVWNGVLHVVPPAGGPHQRLGSELLQVLAPLSKRHGLVASYETGLFRAQFATVAGRLRINWEDDVAEL